MRPINWQDFKDFCVSRGCVYDRTKGDHYMMTKAGISRPIVIPMKRDLKERCIFSNLKTLECSKADLEEFLNPPKAPKSAGAAAGAEISSQE